MTARARWWALVIAVATVTLAPGARADIPLALRFDGQAIEPAAPPDWSCFDASRGQWVSCRVTKAPGPGAYVLAPLPAGRYRMHVSIDENPANPLRYPGDYEAQVWFEVAATTPERLVVDLPRLIHLVRPGDNGRALEGMLTGCATAPEFATPRHSWGPAATVEFAWEPVVAGAEYRYSVVAAPCRRPGPRRQVLAGRTAAAAVTLALPPGAEGDQYWFRVEAWKDGRLVGDLYTHDGGAHAWEYRFQVRNASLPRWAYVAAGSGLLLLLLVAGRALTGLDRPRRRRRLLRLGAGTAVALVLAAAAGAGYRYHEGRERTRAEAERARDEAERRARQRGLAAAFVAAAPRPDWWDTVATPYHADTLGDLLSAWQGYPRSPDRPGERQFFKAAYQGIVDHPDDAYLVATAIELLHYVEHDYPHRLALARFGYERYFHHRQRTDNCANCMVGDTTQGLARNLAALYAAAGRYDEALETDRRLIEARGADVSPYKLAETWNQMAWIHWQKGERERALEVVRDALARYGDTVRGDDLRRTLAAFERER